MTMTNIQQADKIRQIIKSYKNPNTRKFLWNKIEEMTKGGALEDLHPQTLHLLYNAIDHYEG